MIAVKYVTLVKGWVRENWPAHRKQRVLTSSRGLSGSSSWTVVVLLSLAVAADAGDMMTTAQKPGHGSPGGTRGGFPDQGET